MVLWNHHSQQQRPIPHIKSGSTIYSTRVVLHLLDDKSRAKKNYAGVIEGEEAAIIETNYKHQKLVHAKRGCAKN